MHSGILAVCHWHQQHSMQSTIKLSSFFTMLILGVGELSQDIKKISVDSVPCSFFKKCLIFYIDHVHFYCRHFSFYFVSNLCCYPLCCCKAGNSAIVGLIKVILSFLLWQKQTGWAETSVCKMAVIKYCLSPICALRLMCCIVQEGNKWVPFSTILLFFQHRDNRCS